MMRARRQAAARAYGAHPPAQRANGQAGATAHPSGPAAGATPDATRANEQRPNETRQNASGTAENSRAEGAGAPNAQANGGVSGGGGNGRGMAGLPPKWVENLRDKSPAEQERFMQNNERFQSLPTWRQQQVRQNLQKYNNLTPQQKAAMQTAEDNWQRLSPEDRQKVKNELLPKWQGMTPERRQAVNGKLHTLQGVSATDREKALNDPKFMQGLNPDEQSMVKSLSTLRSAPAAQ
jgi:hypothetical protein